VFLISSKHVSSHGAVVAGIVVAGTGVVVGFFSGAKVVSTIVEGIDDLVVIVSDVVVAIVVVAMVVVAKAVVVGTGVVVGAGVVFKPNVSCWYSVVCSIDMNSVALPSL